MADVFETDFVKLADSLESLISYRDNLITRAEEFTSLKSKIQDNWTSDRADLESINTRLDQCIRSIDEAVVPVLNTVIGIMANMGDNASKISSSTIG